MPPQFERCLNKVSAEEAITKRFLNSKAKE
jgi:hypothetical protein